MTRPEDGMVRCPRGHLTPGRFPFCTQCGAELGRAERPEAPAGSAEPGTTPKCPNGHALEDWEAFCTVCGAAVTQRAESPAPRTGRFGPEGARPRGGRAIRGRRRAKTGDGTTTAPLPSVPPPSDPPPHEGREDFVYPPPRRGPDPRLLAAVLAAFVVLGAGARLVALRLRPTPPPAPPPTSVTAAPATTAPVASGVAMAVTSKSIVLDSYTRTYRATALVRNPTDLVARAITVTFVPRAADGRALPTQTRTIASLAPGAIAEVTATAAYSADFVPRTVEVRAVAARIVG